jgi:hypothetical protein
LALLLKALLPLLALGLGSLSLLLVSLDAVKLCPQFTKLLGNIA